MLSTTSQYALRALAELSRQSAGAALLGREVAQRTNIPANYLSKLLWQMRNAGLVAATRGSNGGYRLCRPATEIKLLDVVELFDLVQARPLCLMGQGECNERRACSAHHAWDKVRESYLCFLRETTLAEIAGAGSQGTSPHASPAKELSA